MKICAYCGDMVLDGGHVHPGCRDNYITYLFDEVLS